MIVPCVKFFCLTQAEPQSPSLFDDDEEPANDTVLERNFEHQASVKRPLFKQLSSDDTNTSKTQLSKTSSEPKVSQAAGRTSESPVKEGNTLRMYSLRRTTPSKREAEVRSRTSRAIITPAKDTNEPKKTGSADSSGAEDDRLDTSESEEKDSEWWISFIGFASGVVASFIVLRHLVSKTLVLQFEISEAPHTFLAGMKCFSFLNFIAASCLRTKRTPHGKRRRTPKKLSTSKKQRHSTSEVMTTNNEFVIGLQNHTALGSSELVMYAQNHVFSSVMHQYDVRLPYPAIVYRQ